MSSGLINQIYAQLLNVARIDNEITDDEQALIDNIMKNIRKYYAVVTRKLDEEKSKNMRVKLRKRIMDDALKIAKADDTVTKDEFNILVVLRHALDRIDKLLTK